MKQNLRLFMLTLLCAVFSSAWGQEVTLDLTDSSWGFPTSSKVIQATSYTNSDGYTITVEGTSGNGFRYYTNGSYFLFGKQGASITLPEFDFDVEKIEIVGTSGASADVKVNIYVGETAVSTETKGLKDVTQSYAIASDYQETGNIYKIVVTSAHNAQASAIKIYEKGSSSSTVDTPTFNPADGTTFNESQEVSISCSTNGATIYYTTDGTTPSTTTTTSTTYTAPFTITETTTVKAIAVADGMTNSSVATATYTKVASLTLKTIAQAREQATGEVLTQGVITSLNGNYAYIQDTDAAIYIYGGCSAFSIGDEIKVQGTLSTFRGLMEITPTSCTLVESGKTVTPQVMTIAEVNASTNQGWLIKIEEATVQSIASNDQDVTIAQGTNTILVRFNKPSDIPFAANDIITLTGNIGCFNTVQIANPRDITVKVNVEPTITVDPDEINLDCNGDSGEMTLTLDNFEEEPDEILVQFYSDASCETSIEPLDWVSIDTESMTYTVEENTGAARTAYLKVYAFESESGDYIYSNLITINQEAYVEPAEPKTYQKVTSTADITDGNYLIVYEGDNTHTAVAFDGSLATLDASSNTIAVTINDDVIEDNHNAYFTIDVANGTIKSASGHYIGVSSNSNGLKQSDNASDYTNSFAITNGQAVISAAFENSNMTLRYNYGSNQNRFRYYGNGQQPIQLYKEVDEIVKVPTVEVNPSGVNVGADGGDGTITVTYKNFEEVTSVSPWLYALDGEEEIECDWIYISLDDDWNVYYDIEPNDGEARTAYLVVNAWDVSGETAVSSTIVFNQEAYVVDFAEIPFEFNGGRADVENTTGLTQTGLGTDYKTDNTKLKFDGTGDELILKLEEHAETTLELAYDIKGNTFSGGTFTVLISADGNTYEELATYTELSAVQTEVFNLDEDIRYIKWEYTEKVNGNIGLGNIQVIVPEEIVISFNKRAEGYSTLFYGTKNFIIPDGVKAYTYKVGDDGKAVETEYENYIPKGSAVIIELEDKSVFTANTYDVTFTTTAGSETAHTDNMLYGFDEGGNTTVGPDETKEYLFYSLSLNKNKDEGSIGFYWNQPDGAAFTMPAHRAYLSVEKETANGVSAFIFDGIGTGINGIFANGLPTDSVYTISGVRVNSDRLQKGIYIVNGNKVVIK